MGVEQPARAVRPAARRACRLRPKWHGRAGRLGGAAGFGGPAVKEMEPLPAPLEVGHCYREAPVCVTETEERWRHVRAVATRIALGPGQMCARGAKRSACRTGGADDGSRPLLGWLLRRSLACTEHRSLWPTCWPSCPSSTSRAHVRPLGAESGKTKAEAVVTIHNRLLPSSSTPSGSPRLCARRQRRRPRVGTSPPHDRREPQRRRDRRHRRPRMTAR